MIVNRYKEFQRLAAVSECKYLPALNRIEFIYVGPENYHVVQSPPPGNQPLIAYTHYNTPLMWWAIALHNKIKHPMFGFKVGQTLRIPTDPFAIERGVTMV